MEPDTVSTPKINKSTFSFGSGSLMKRVANNEKKITVLKNIIQTNRSNIGEKITPKMSSNFTNQKANEKPPKITPKVTNRS